MANETRTANGQATTPAKADEAKAAGVAALPVPTCGIVMPISDVDGYPAGHWQDVKLLIVEAMRDAGVDADLVSNADSVDIIQKRIIDNLYSSALVVCDVSARNPNVMFELGMRLTFDKPTIIVKDDATPFSFDTSLIEHIVYRRDLRHADAVAFKAKLAAKAKSLLDKVKTGAFAPFLDAIGPVRSVTPKTETVSPADFLAGEVSSLRKDVAGLGAIVRSLADVTAAERHRFFYLDEQGQEAHVVAQMLRNRKNFGETPEQELIARARDATIEAFGPRMSPASVERTARRAVELARTMK